MSQFGDATVHVLLPVHNARDLTLACLAQLADQTYGSMEVVVIDDGSTDGSAEAIRRQFPDVTILTGDGALWWTGAMAMGVEHVLGRCSEGDFVLCMNNDVSFGVDYVAKLTGASIADGRGVVASFCRKQADGVVVDQGCRIDWAMGRRQMSLDLLREELRRRGLPAENPADVTDDMLDEIGELRGLDWLYGRGTLVPIEVFSRAGNFDGRRFPHYGGDTEFFYRAGQAGFELLISLKARIVNIESEQTTGIHYRPGAHLTWRQAWGVLFSRRSSYQLAKSFRFISRCCPWRYRLRNKLRAVRTALGVSFGRTRARQVLWGLLRGGRSDRPTRKPELPKITFGVIVFNGEPFTRYCLRAIYPFAHEIIVVEGASRGAEPVATPDGHSTDGTLETLRRFKDECDPDDKLQIVTRDGPWGDKDEQSQAYADRATGEYLWQVDIDEFYHPDDMHRVIRMLRDRPTITAVSFEQITFWGSGDIVADSWYLRHEQEMCHRLFKWGPGYRYQTHRPPTVVDGSGRDLRAGHWVNGRQLVRQGIYMHHYSLLFPRQVRQKCAYYATQPWGAYAAGAVQWAEENFLSPITRPFQVHNVHIHPSWLERFTGEHPPAVAEMMADIDAGRLDVQRRDNSDAEALLSLRRYRWLRAMLKCMAACRLPGRMYRWMMKLRYDHRANRIGWRTGSRRPRRRDE